MGSIPGDAPTSQVLKGYFITYDVVAESPEHTIRWIKEFEHVEATHVALSVEESEILEARPNEPMGVYWCTGRLYYDDEEDDE